MRRETFDERRTDDDGVGGAGHLPRLFRVLDAEAGGDRQRREAAQPSGKPSARIQTISCGSVTMVIARSGPAASASRDDSAAGKAARNGAISRSRRVVKTVSIISVASFLSDRLLPDVWYACGAAQGGDKISLRTKSKIREGG
jgi:hypothetical protein